MSSGSVRTFRSHRTLPTSSTTQTDVSSTETSKPTKCAIAAAPSPMLEVRPTPDPIIVCEGLHVHRWKDQAQPPRYTIFPRFPSRKQSFGFRPGPDVRPSLPGVDVKPLKRRVRTGLLFAIV